MVWFRFRGEGLGARHCEHVSDVDPALHLRRPARHQSRHLLVRGASCIRVTCAGSGVNPRGLCRCGTAPGPLFYRRLLTLPASGSQLLCVPACRRSTQIRPTSARQTLVRGLQRHSTDAPVLDSGSSNAKRRRLGHTGRAWKESPGGYPTATALAPRRCRRSTPPCCQVCGNLTPTRHPEDFRKSRFCPVYLGSPTCGHEARFRAHSAAKMTFRFIMST